MKILFASPPGPVYVRGEERCGVEVDRSFAVINRFPIDIAYDMTFLEKEGYEVSYFDFAGEGYSESQAIRYIKVLSPDVIVVHGGLTSYKIDKSFFKLIKQKFPEIKLILKGKIFYYFDMENYDYIDCIVASHSPQALIDALKNSYSKVLNEYEFPLNMRVNRKYFNHSLYVRPDTGELQTTIQVSIGCPFSCTYCLAPILHGKRIIYRRVEDVIDEIKSVLNNYDIKNFFIRADCFTFDKKWALKFALSLIKENLNISWVTSTRVDTADIETLKLLKKSGLWLLSVGFESGSNKTLKLIKKNTTYKKNLEFANIVKKSGIKLYAFYMLGFPWENIKDIKKTERLILKSKPYFFEIHFPVAYPGTDFYKKYASSIVNYEFNYFSCSNCATKIPFKKLKLIKYLLFFRIYFSPVQFIQNRDIIFNFNVWKYLIKRIINYLKYI